MRLCHRCNKETTHFRGKRAIWYLDDKKSLCGKCYVKKNKNKYSQSAKKYREAHPQRIKESMKEYEKTPKAKARHKRYAQRHPEKIKALRDKWTKINQGLRFRGKQIVLGFDPRSGICSDCKKSKHKGEIKTTNLHHWFYDESKPCENVVELCVSCHNKRHPQTRNMLGQFKIQI